MASHSSGTAAPTLKYLIAMHRQAEQLRVISSSAGYRRDVLTSA